MDQATFTLVMLPSGYSIIESDSSRPALAYSHRSTVFATVSFGVGREGGGVAHQRRT